MISPRSSTLPTRLVALRRGLLVALLAALYLVLWQGPGTLIGKMFFVVHLGLFMLWQPFVHAERHLSVKSLLGVVGVVATASLFLTGWLLSVWIMMLAGIVGGKVLLFDARASRLFFLLALGFLVMALLLMAAPMALPMVNLPELFVRLAYIGLPLILIAMALLPQGPEQDSAREAVDFISSLFVFLLLAVLMLGSLAAMLMFGSAYVEGLLQTLLLLGTTLLLLGWAWNPHAGFSGLGNMFSRYMMSIGLPVEEWLQALADLASRVEDPQRFLEDACDDMARRLPWVIGGEWAADGSDGRFGVTDGLRWEFSHDGMTLALYTQHPLSPTLVWHFNLLARLLAEFYADKRRTLALKQLSYMQAIHETGARLTHDVKNLLQSLNALCSAGIEPGAESSREYQALLRRQLPAISARLAGTLAKLNAPQGISAARWMPAVEWWQELCQRMAALDWVDFKAQTPIAGELPEEVFSGVVENLIRNAIEKRLREPALQMRIELIRNDAGFELIARDDGSAMTEDIVARLFVGPVPSESGYGIGLFHTARYAQAVGYRLELVENRAGRVCFRLARAT
ncbi:MAG: sensor histidine kinase [Sulfuritalea sp.]|nr:sensor histidine kinase [Sulfuritalea sp.]